MIPDIEGGGDTLVRGYRPGASLTKQTGDIPDIRKFIFDQYFTETLRDRSSAG